MIYISNYNYFFFSALNALGGNFAAGLAGGFLIKLPSKKHLISR
jgi:hypothetical protein